MQLPPRIGWPGAVAALALAAALPLATLVTPGWQHQAVALRAAERPQALPPPPPPLARLPEVGATHERVASLMALATRDGVAVERSQQKLDDAPLVRLQLSMGVQGGYAELRGFIADALQADPGLALDRLRLRRPNAQASTLEADLQWSLLMPNGAPP